MRCFTTSWFHILLKVSFARHWQNGVSSFMRSHNIKYIYMQDWVELLRTTWSREVACVTFMPEWDLNWRWKYNSSDNNLIGCLDVKYDQPHRGLVAYFWKYYREYCNTILQLWWYDILLCFGIISYYVYALPATFCDNNQRPWMSLSHEILHRASVPILVRKLDRVNHPDVIRYQSSQ